MPSPENHPPPLSVSRAFVVQFQANTNIPQGRCAGRVEHVASGQTAMFDTLDDLLDFVSRVLTTIPLHP